MSSTPQAGAGRTYLRKGAENLQGRIFDESLIPRPDAPRARTSLAELEAVTAQRDVAEYARADLEGEVEALRERLAAIKAENEAVPETHDWNEEKTRRLLIDLALHRAGWRLDSKHDREYEVTGMPNESGIGYADYVLWGDDGKPLAVVEAKKTTVDPEQRDVKHVVRLVVRQASLQEVQPGVDLPRQLQLRHQPPHGADAPEAHRARPRPDLVVDRARREHGLRPRPPASRPAVPRPNLPLPPGTVPPALVMRYSLHRKGLLVGTGRPLPESAIYNQDRSFRYFLTGVRDESRLSWD